MADVIIRQASAEDVADIYEIEQLCFPDPWSRDSIRYELEENERAFYLVAEHSGKVVGYAGLWWILDEGHITNVAVRPGYRNRKIAEGIIRIMIEHTLSAGILHHTLEVRRDNQPAISLYGKFGFEVDGVRKGYYQFDGEDALIMWRHATDEEVAAWEAAEAAKEAEAIKRTEAAEVSAKPLRKQQPKRHRNRSKK